MSTIQQKEWAEKLKKAEFEARVLKRRIASYSNNEWGCFRQACKDYLAETENLSKQQEKADKIMSDLAFGKELK